MRSKLGLRPDLPAMLQLSQCLRHNEAGCNCSDIHTQFLGKVRVKHSVEWASPQSPGDNTAAN